MKKYFYFLQENLKVIKVFVDRELLAEERVTENASRKQRREVIDTGSHLKSLRIRNLHFQKRMGDGWLPVCYEQLVTERLSGQLIELSHLIFNVSSIIDLEQRMFN